MAVSYEEGRGILKDYNEAAKWYRRAAGQGAAKAQLNLGSLYAAGLGVPQDNVYAHMWFNIAGSHGEKLGIERRDSVAEHMTASDISKANELARESVRKKYKAC